MDLQEAKALAIKLMKEWELSPEWSFAFDRAVKRFGCCKISKRKITLSRKLTKLNKREHVRDTILHEIAHALDFGDRGRSDHGANWKIWAELIGAKPKRCYESAKINGVPAKYYDYCPTCGWKTGRQRRKLKGNLYSCPRCCSQFNIDYLTIPNIPAAKMQQIKESTIAWYQLPQAEKVMTTLEESRHVYANNPLYQQYKNGALAA